ncbi:serine/threonine-protein kinase [Streptomyces sp. NBC_00986]|uniref:serine/threonine-protein kinase n=1 Tax=Streptomyces sp. NBC_00986 TaxID=2903702 RepID=UPI00386F8CC4|nr:serine/threonine protein kinase [Streptomyces sp. NBC_00986]
MSGGYVRERELGRGGQGVVWLARDRPGQQGVVKFLLPGTEFDEVVLARVRREFGAASRVGELATARVLDADLTGQHPYIVGEFVQGPTIQQHVAAGGPLPSGRLQSLGPAVAHALAQVHRVGVVHRDIKPSNILLSPDGPRIIDFGIARDDRSLESALTTPGSVLGPPAYMSPTARPTRGARPTTRVSSASPRPKCRRGDVF